MLTAQIEPCSEQLQVLLANNHIPGTFNERLMIHFNPHFKRNSHFRTADVALVYPNPLHPAQEYWQAATLSLRTSVNSPVLFKTQATSVRKAITSEGFIIIQMRLHYSDMDKGHCQDGSNMNGGALTACTGCIMQVLRGLETWRTITVLHMGVKHKKGTLVKWLNYVWKPFRWLASIALAS